MNKLEQTALVPTLYLRQAGLTCNPTFLYLYCVRCRGQARLRKPRSNANTHVVGNKAAIPRIAIGYERQKKEEGEV